GLVTKPMRISIKGGNRRPTLFDMEKAHIGTRIRTRNVRSQYQLLIAINRHGSSERACGAAKRPWNAQCSTRARQPYFEGNLAIIVFFGFPLFCISPSQIAGVLRKANSPNISRRTAKVERLATCFDIPNADSVVFIPRSGEPKIGTDGDPSAKVA